MGSKMGSEIADSKVSLGTGSLTVQPAQSTFYLVEGGRHDISLWHRVRAQLLKISPMVTLKYVPVVRNALDSAMILACKSYWGVMPTRSRITLLLISYTDIL